VADWSRDDLRVSVRELVEQVLALGLAQALPHDLPGDLRAHAPELLGIELLVLDHVTDAGVRLVLMGLVHAPFDERILDLRDHVAGPEDAHPAGLAVDAHMDILVAGRHPTIRGLDGILDGVHELLARHTLLGVELEEGADEVPVHVPSWMIARFEGSRSRKNVGVTHVHRRPRLRS
jgi:hypothetical protein